MVHELNKVSVTQSDLVGILHSSGTTRKVQGVMLTHKNLTTVIAEYHYYQLLSERSQNQRSQLYSTRSRNFTQLSEAVAVMERFDAKEMWRAVQLNLTMVQTCVSILFVGYILMQVPSNMLLTKIGKPSAYLCACMVAWVSFAVLSCQSSTNA